MTDQPFVVFGLPRSRTAWLARFLSYGEWTCHHDALLQFDGLKDMITLLRQEKTGLSETSLAAAWPIIRFYFPKAKFVVVKRDIEEIRASLENHDWSLDMLEKRAEFLDEISKQPGTLTVKFEDLNKVETCKKVFQHCLEAKFDKVWWDVLQKKDIQVDMDARKKQSIERTPYLINFFQEAKAFFKDVTIQNERWEDVAEDVKALATWHWNEVGGYEGEEFDPNYELVSALAKAGALVLTTARAGGLLIGYLAFIIEPSIKNRKDINAVQSAFYVRPTWRGRAGLQMHRYAVKQLKDNGISRLTLRAGIRGTGNKQDRMFKRLGAVEDGTVYNLYLGDK